MRFVMMIAMVLATASCVSTHMKKFVGEDIREVVLSDGPPANAFDYGEGRRVFQFYWGGGTYVMPGATTTTGNAFAIGSTVYASSTSLNTPGAIIESKGCLVSYVTRWRPEQKAWIVEEIKFPSRAFC